MQLFTDRLELFKGVPEDTKFAEWVADPEVVKYSELRHRPKAPIVESDNRLCDRWTVMLDGAEIGRLAATYDEPNNTADLSIMMGAKEHWGQGYGTEAWCAVLEYLLKTNRKVTAGTMCVNKGMRRIFNKSGMTYDGLRVHHYLLDGEPVDVYLAAKFDREWWLE